MVLAPSNKARYFASIDDNDNVGCNLLDHAIGKVPSLQRIPEVECLVSTSPTQFASCEDRQIAMVMRWIENAIVKCTFKVL